MDARQCYESGRLADAIEAQVKEVKANPLDRGKRTFLFELLAFAGQLDRAQTQLEALGHDDTGSAWGASVYQNLLAAERMRRKVFAGGLKPEMFLDPPEFIAWRYDALQSLCLGRTSAAAELLNRSDAAAPSVRGALNGRPVEGLRDADDLLAPILEVMVLKDYIWVPWTQIKEFELASPAHPRDLLWSPVRLVLADGVQRRAYLPVQYPGTYEADDDALKLGRLTDWLVPEEGPVRGMGQHLLVAGQADFGLLEVRTFAAA